MTQGAWTSLKCAPEIPQSYDMLDDFVADSANHKAEIKLEQRQVDPRKYPKTPTVA